MLFMFYLLSVTFITPTKNKSLVSYTLNLNSIHLVQNLI